MFLGWMGLGLELIGPCLKVGPRKVLVVVKKKA